VTVAIMGPALGLQPRNPMVVSVPLLG
jgi:hypothetical protein